MEQGAFVLGGRPVEVWPDGQKLAPRGDPAIIGTRFDDVEAYHPELIAGVLAAAAPDDGRARRYLRAGGGTKIYHLESWGLPALDLVCARARELFRRTFATDRAVVDLSWANVYGAGDYAMAHSHERTPASLVYFVDPGDTDPRDPLAGRFAVVDARIAHCAGGQSPRVISPLMPRLAAGDMLIFPSAMVHSVNPYAGGRPRITLAWNIGPEPIPGAALPFEA